MSLCESNRIKILQYWKEFNKTGNQKSMSKCYGAMSDGSLNHKLNYFGNQMHILNDTERNNSLKTTVLIYWSEEIEFIIKNRHTIRANPQNISFANKELFAWMKQQNEYEYYKFKIDIHNLLLLLKEIEADYEQIKIGLAKIISCYLENKFIRL